MLDADGCCAKCGAGIPSEGARGLYIVRTEHAPWCPRLYWRTDSAVGRICGAERSTAHLAPLSPPEGS